jgi:hypothetical protein
MKWDRPPEDKLTPDQVMTELQQAGFKTERLEESLPEQYIIRATVP